MTVDTEGDLDGLKQIGQIVGLAVQEMKQAVQPGMTTAELDAIGGEFLSRYGARSAPQLVYNFPGVNCISLNDEAVHGVPGPRAIQPGDLLKIDVTAELDGYIADSAITVIMPPVSPLKRKLVACAETAFRQAMAVARSGQPINELGRVVEREVKRQGFFVLRQLSGHGVGRTIHEEPSAVPNYYERRLGTRFAEGMVVAVEPIIAAGSSRTVTGKDGWTIKTADGSLAAHYEHTIVIRKGAPLILTAV